jgi:hypothetical protein
MGGQKMIERSRLPVIKLKITIPGGDTQSRIFCWEIYLLNAKVQFSILTDTWFGSK